MKSKIRPLLWGVSIAGSLLFAGVGHAQNKTYQDGSRRYYYFYNDTTADRTVNFTIPNDSEIVSVRFHLWGAPGGRQGNDGPLANQSPGGHGGYVSGIAKTSDVDLRGQNISIQLTNSTINGSRSGDNNDGPGEDAGFSYIYAGPYTFRAGGGLAGGKNVNIVMGWYVLNRNGAFNWGDTSVEFLNQFSYYRNPPVSRGTTMSAGQYQIRQDSYTSGRGGYDSANGMTVLLGPLTDGGASGAIDSNYIGGYVASLFNIREGNGRMGYSQRYVTETFSSNNNGTLDDIYPALRSAPFHIISQTRWEPAKSAATRTSSLQIARRIRIGALIDRAKSLGVDVAGSNVISGSSLTNKRSLSGNPLSNGSYSGIPSAAFVSNRNQPGYNLALDPYVSGRASANAGYAAAMLEVIYRQPQTVSVASSATEIDVGSSATFTASGGNTSYLWSGAASGTGETKTISFPTAGQYTVSVQAVASDEFQVSNTASTTINVVQNQAAVTVTPQNPTLFVGGSVTLTAGGGSGTGAFVWGGDITGSTGSTRTVSFGSTGSYSVTLYREASPGYRVSSPVTATINVVNPPPVPAAAIPSGSGVIWFNDSDTVTP